MSENINIELSELQATKIAEELVKQRSQIFAAEGNLYSDPEVLRRAIADEPDLRIIQEMLKKHLQHYTDQNFVNERIGKVEVSVVPKFNNRENIVVGGWLMAWNAENKAVPGVLTRVTPFHRGKVGEGTRIDEARGL